jgi:hypothetical protein
MGMQISTSIMESNMEILQKAIDRAAIWFCDTTPGYVSKELKSGYRWDTCTPRFIAALFTIAKVWKQPRWLTTDEWIKEILYIYTMEFYSAIGIITTCDLKVNGCMLSEPG